MISRLPGARRGIGVPRVDGSEYEVQPGPSTWRRCGAQARRRKRRCCRHSNPRRDTYGLRASNTQEPTELDFLPRISPKRRPRSKARIALKISTTTTAPNTTSTPNTTFTLTQPPNPHNCQTQHQKPPKESRPKDTNRATAQWRSPLNLLHINTKNARCLGYVSIHRVKYTSFPNASAVRRRS
jgi:hypothetical protein